MKWSISVLSSTTRTVGRDSWVTYFRSLAGLVRTSAFSSSSFNEFGWFTGKRNLKMISPAGDSSNVNDHSCISAKERAKGSPSPVPDLWIEESSR